MRVYVAGHTGMVGSAILRALAVSGHMAITVPRDQVDLTNQQATRDFIAAQRPDAVILAAARVGGIGANNTYPAQFIYENIMIAANVIHASYLAGVGKLLFLGSSCIYPRDAAQPMVENALLTGPLEPTNEPYAIAKIAGIKLCESYNRQYGTDYRAIMPTNLYGPGDNFHPENAHVLPALLDRFHDATRNNAPEVRIWGTGAARREFLHVDDLAQAALFVLQLPRDAYDSVTSPMQRHLNVGTGRDISIAGLASLIAGITGFVGNVRFDTSKPDGPRRKLLEIQKLAKLGWSAKIDLQAGMGSTYDWYKEQLHSGQKLRLG